MHYLNKLRDFKFLQYSKNYKMTIFLQLWWDKNIINIWIIFKYLSNEESHEEGVVVCIADGRVPQTNTFKYFGFYYSKKWRYFCDVTHRIWKGWLAATGVLCHKSVPLMLKGKLYRVAIRPSLLYDSECWPLRKAQEHRLETTEMHMLCWICGNTMTGHISNVTFRLF